MNERILVVDDEKEIADLIELILCNEHYEVKKFYNGLQAIEYANNHQLDCAVLDVMLPDIDGFSLCQKLREKHTFPIIFLTAKVEDTDKITGLMIGADDYMSKPFNPLELSARVKAQLRKQKRYMEHFSSNLNQEYQYQGLYINKEAHICTYNNTKVSLTSIEFNILFYLLENRGRVISSEELFEAIWKEKYFDANNTVMAHIARIREKLNEPVRKPKIIKTVWGVGYQIE